jgi:hypothetical protein
MFSSSCAVIRSSQPTVEVVRDEGLAGVLAEAIYDGNGGRMTRGAEVSLATSLCRIGRNGWRWQAL